MSEIVAYNDECAGVVKWIQSRTLLNRSGLCLASGIDRGNFDKFMQKGSIPKKHMPKLVTVLKDYGYNFGGEITEQEKNVEDVEKKHDKHYTIPKKNNKLREPSQNA